MRRVVSFMQDFEIFRVGRHTAVNGTSIGFSEADLAGAVSAYDPALHEAPLVVGHPTTDAPAYGWVASLRLDGDRLVATPNQVDTAFADLVSAGRFKKRSASFYPPDHPSNPKPGNWYLKHVGFLGAIPPAVKGLREVAFGQVEGELEFADWNGLSVAKLFTGLREFLIAQFGQDRVDAVLPADDIDSLKFQAAQPEPDPADPSDYVENPDMTTTSAAEIAAREQKLAEQEAALAASQAAFAEQQRQARGKAASTFVDSLVAAGRFPSAEKAGLVAFMEALPEGDAVIEFAEAGGKTAKATPVDYLTALLGRLPNLVHFGEVAGGETVAFAETEQAITALSRKYIAEQKAVGRQVSVAEAVSHVRSMRR
jgi:hypothetical protein